MKIVSNHVENDRQTVQSYEPRKKNQLTFLDGANFLNILLELHADLPHHTAVLLAHLSSQKRAFGGYRLARGWHRMASRQLGHSIQFRACKQTKQVLHLSVINSNYSVSHFINCDS